MVEVNNTFGERHCYLLERPRLRPGARARAKVFHVSPFCRVEGGYRFRFLRIGTTARTRTVVRIDYDDADGPLLQTSVSGALEPVDAAQPAARALALSGHDASASSPASTGRPFRLWLKRVPFVASPAAPAVSVTPMTTLQRTASRSTSSRLARHRLTAAGGTAAARTALSLLRSLRHGTLTLQLPDGSLRHFGERR